MKAIRPYLGVLYQVMLNSAAKFLSFRLSVVFNLVVELAAFFSMLLSVHFILAQVGQIGPWGRTEFMLFVFWYQTIVCLHGSLIGPNFWNFSTEVRTGNLDFRLLRPLGGLFDVLTAISRPGALVMLPVYIGFLVHYLIVLKVPLLVCLLVPVLILLSFALVALLETCIALSMLWTKGGDGINFIRMQGQQLQRWPDFMYPGGIRWFFTRVIPTLTAVSFPVRFVIDRSEWPGVIYVLGATVVMWFVVGVVWRAGLRRYESASS